jgi:hypothetical protein
MTANEWLEVMQKANNFPKGMERLIVKYGEMKLKEIRGESKPISEIDQIKEKYGITDSDIDAAVKIYVNGKKEQEVTPSDIEAWVYKKVGEKYKNLNPIIWAEDIKYEINYHIEIVKAVLNGEIKHIE